MDTESDLIEVVPTGFIAFDSRNKGLRKGHVLLITADSLTSKQIMIDRFIALQKVTDTIVALVEPIDEKFATLQSSDKEFIALDCEKHTTFIYTLVQSKHLARNQNCVVVIFSCQKHESFSVKELVDYWWHVSEPNPLFVVEEKNRFAPCYDFEIAKE